MDAPKCRVCGKRHWGLCDEARVRQGVPPQATAAPVVPPPAPEPDRPAPIAHVAETPGPADGEISKALRMLARRREYMKGYMRKRRAADKAGV